MGIYRKVWNVWGLVTFTVVMVASNMLLQVMWWSLG